MYDFMIDGMGNMHWRRSGKEYASKTTADALIGYKEFVDRVNGDIALYTEHAEVLKMAGVSKSFNYLLHGPPGVCGWWRCWWFATFSPDSIS